MFASSAASSRALIVRNCRRRSRPSPLFAHAKFNNLACARGENNYSYINSNFNSSLDSSPRFAFSTISFIGNTGFDPISTSTSSPESVNLRKPPNTTSGQEISSESAAAADPVPSHQFQQQIQQWITTNPKIAPYKAEEALARLWVEQQELFQQWEEQQNLTLQPTILLTSESVNLVLQAWCNSNKGEVAAERAERLLHWMEDLASDPAHPSSWANFLPEPNFQSYATAIDAWSRAAVYESAHPSPSSNETAETKSRGRAKAHVVSHATKDGFDCAKRAEDLLMHMQKMHEQQLTDSEQYNSEIQPDTRVFNLVLKAWSNIHGGTKASAIRAMRILDLMQELYHYQSMDAPEWQGIVLSKVQPNLKTYKLVLDAWAHAAHTVEGPDRAEEILRHLLSMSKAGNMGAEIMPDAECFHIVMKAHAEAVRKKRKGDDGTASVERAQKVTALLNWMELLAPRSKIRPTSESYRVALSAWVWSHHVDAPKEAEAILFRMIHAADVNIDNAKILAGNNADAKRNSDSQAVMPETRDFNTVINSCSFARKIGVNREDEDDLSLVERQMEHQETFNIAEGALNALIASPYAQPDSATFAGIMRACVNLLPNTDDRDTRVIELFQLAYRTPLVEAPSSRISSTSSERMRAPPGAGCVDANLLRQLRNALPSTQDYIRVREEFEEFRRQNVGEE